MPLLIEITFQDGHYHLKITELFSEFLLTSTYDKNEIRKMLLVELSAAKMRKQQIIAADHTSEFMDLFQDFNEIHV